jgi:hypothetical protein
MSVANPAQHFGATPDTNPVDQSVHPKYHGSMAGAPYLLVRPLIIANSALILPPEQQVWIKSILSILGEQHGVIVASKVAKTLVGHSLPLFSVGEGFDFI